MSDEIIGGLASEESGEDKARVPLPHRVPADPIATALLFGNATQNPHFVEEAIAYLRDARVLVQYQTEKLREEDPVIPATLTEGWLRRLSLRLRIVFFTIAGMAILAFVASMIWSAASSHSVIVEAFDVPPSFAARGITGRALAAGLLDELTRLRDATRSSFTPLEAQSAWASDIKVLVPDTGVSIGEIDRVLHMRLGRDLHIQGELMEALSGRIALRVRGDGVPAKTFEGTPADLPKLTTEAAEWVYARSQPHEFAAYLTDSGRDQEALDFLPGAFARAAPDARAPLANTWGVAYNDLNRIGEAVAKYRLAISLKPRYWRAWSNLVAAMPISDGEEATWKEARAFQAAWDRALPPDRPPLNLVAPIGIATRNYALVLRGIQADIAGTPGGTGTVAAASSLAANYESLHDWASAHRNADLTAPDDPMKAVGTAQLAGAEAIDRGDFTAAIPPLETFRKLRRASPLIQSYIYDDCILGYAYGMAGRVTEAEAIFAANGAWSECLAWRGATLAKAGRSGDAEQVWAAAIRAMPDLPEAYLMRGLWRAAHHEIAGAVADFLAAHAGAPHFADPLKAWGDLLAAQGRWAEARAKYTEALADAPGWVALRQASDADAAGRPSTAP